PVFGRRPGRLPPTVRRDAANVQPAHTGPAVHVFPQPTVPRLLVAAVMILDVLSRVQRGGIVVGLLRQELLVLLLVVHLRPVGEPLAARARREMPVSPRPRSAILPGPGVHNGPTTSASAAWLSPTRHT